MARSPLRAGLLLGLLCSAFAAASAQPGPDSLRAVAFTPPAAELLDKLEAQGVLLAEESPAGQNGDRAGSAQALVLFRRPRAEVLRMLASTPRQKEYRPELTRLDLVEAGERGDVADYRVRFMLTTLRYRARHGWDLEAGRVWWTLDPSADNDMAALDGLWELHALDERRTLGRFTTRIDLGPALPAFLQDYATRKKLPESMDQVRRWVDSGGRWRP